MNLHVLTHSFPTRRSSELPERLGRWGCVRWRRCRRNAWLFLSADRHSIGSWSLKRHEMPAFAGMTVIGSNEYLADPFGDHRGFVFALDLDGKFGGLLPLAGALFIEREQREAAAHALARADGLEEAHPVAAVIDAHLRDRKSQRLNSSH